MAATHCGNGNDGGSLSMREASGSGTFDWLVVRCGGSAVVSSLEGGASTR